VKPTASFDPTMPGVIDESTGHVITDSVSLPLDVLFQDYQPDTICVNCGCRFDDDSQCHEIWKEDPCYFSPNTDAHRLMRIRNEVRHMVGLGMTPEEIENAVRQTVLALAKDQRR